MYSLKQDSRLYIWEINDLEELQALEDLIRLRLDRYRKLAALNN